MTEGCFVNPRVGGPTPALGWRGILLRKLPTKHFVQGKSVVGTKPR
jgi:hypothetical protein